MTDPFAQATHAIRLDWGPVGARATPADIAVVVDVLSFSTAVCVAVERGTVVLPYRWRGRDAERFAAAVRAAAAGPDGLVPGGARRVGASVGVAHSTPGDTRTTLLTRADRAMYDVQRAARRSQP